jgi:flagellar hook-length control protein FliK
MGPSLPGISGSADLLSTSPKTKLGVDSFKDVLKANNANSANRKETTVRKDDLFQRDEDVTVATEPRMAPEDRQSRDETITVREKRRAEKSGKEKSASDSSDREQVMLKFMDSMESEFGIPPQRIAEAMAKLPEDELEGSAEDSAPQVISQLNLSPEDQQRALQMYMSFLQKLNTTEPPQQVAVTQVPVLPAVSAQDKRLQLNQSLDRLNNRFFMKAEQQEAFQQNGQPMVTRQSAMEMSGALEDLPQPQDTQGPMESPLQGGLIDPRKLGMTPVSPGQDFNPKSAEAEAMAKASNRDVMAEMVKTERASQAKGQSEDADRAALEQKLAALGAAAGALSQGIKTDPQNQQALKAEQTLQQMQGQQNPQQNLMGAMAVNGAGQAAWSQGDENLDDQGSGGKGKDAFSPSSIAAAGGSASHLMGDMTSKSLPSATPTFAGAMAAQSQSSAENNPNVRQIMNQAQYMIKKGGGEAKIQLNPEGLGEIHMKVAVRDGKVDLHIATQTHEAKKLVESSMQELRDSLNHKNLGMEAVKVDVGNHLAGDKHHSDQQMHDQGQQRQMDMRQDLSREQSKSQAREFWNQFNDDGGFSRRAALLDSPGIRAYGGSRRAAPLPPAETSAPSDRRYVQSGKGRGIDLVA